MAERRPNIVLILTDQQRWNALGCYGHPVVRTPHLDALAEAGVRFEHAYVPVPLCTPSRACLMTGCYPTVHGIRTNETVPLRADLPTLPGALRAAGYQTFLMGKDHIFNQAGRQRDWDRVALFGHGGREAGSAGSAEDAAVRAFRRDLMRQPWVDAEPFPPEACTTARITDQALAAIEQRSPDQPFFLWLSYPDPHPPFVVCEPYASMYRNMVAAAPPDDGSDLESKPLRHRVTRTLMQMERYSADDLRRIREIYYGMISFIDDQVGRLVLRLRQLDLYRNTAFVFMSDHGEYLGDHGLLRKSPSLWDVLVRIPLIVVWPEGCAGGRVVGSTMAESVDIMPTLLDWAGSGIPRHIQGRSLVPLLDGRCLTHRDRVHGCYGTEGAPYTEDEVLRVDFEALFRHPHGGGNWLNRLVMQGRFLMERTLDWKLIYYNNGAGELYNLRDDPGERVNLYGAGRHAEVERALLESLLRWSMDAAPALPPYGAPPPPGLEER